MNRNLPLICRHAKGHLLQQGRLLRRFRAPMRKSRAGMRRRNPDIDLSGLKGDMPTSAQ